MTITTSRSPFVPASYADSSIGSGIRLASAQAWTELANYLTASGPSVSSLVAAATVEELPYLEIPDVGVATETGRRLATLRAHQLVHQAWEARSSRRASEVDDTAWDTFRAKLVEAERILVQVIAQAADAADAWALRLTTSRGLSLGLGESERRFDRFAALAPHHLPGRKAWLQELAPKWHGSWERMFAFARDEAKHAADGSLAHSLIVDAHLERWAAEGPRVLTSTEVVAEVIESATRSVLHPTSARGFLWLQAHSDLALFFSLADLPGHARVHFTAISDHAVEGTWSYLEDPWATFYAYRNLAMNGTKR